MKKTNLLLCTLMALLVPIGTAHAEDKAIPTTNKLIVGGMPVSNISDTPWQVALVRHNTRDQFCGGSLVAPNWVLTAAHCVDNPGINQNPSRLDVVAGTLLFTTGGEQIAVSKIVVHPRWNSSNFDFDAALLKLDNTSSQGSPIAMQKAGDKPEVGVEVRVSGWGATSMGGAGSQNLLFAMVPVVSNDTCNEKDSYDGAITTAMICAGERAGGVDACQGDSGGPVDGGTQLLGIVSWGYGCALALKYGVYTRVSEVSDWANQAMGEN